MTTYVNHRGEPIDLKTLMGKAAEQRKTMGVRGRREPTPSGYAAPPGTGPEGKTCADCKHKHTMHGAGKKSWIKCDLMRGEWTGGRGSDILAGSLACKHFEAKEEHGSD